MRNKYKNLEKELNNICLNRVDEIRALILAHISRTHIVMLGTPGTAKSYLVRKFSEAFPNDSDKTSSIPYFEVALNNFTKPEDVFGPIDVNRWKTDSELVYKTQNFLPNCRIAFIDELSRGESVLNSLLTIVNERTFNVNGIATKVPLDMAVSATNFKLSDVEMEAMRDRFLQWLNPKKLTKEEDKISMWMAEETSLSMKFSESEVAKVRSEVDAVKLNVDTLKTFNILLDDLNKELGITLSDRRTKMMIRLIKASAWYNGHTEIQTDDLKDLWSCCWTDENDIAKIKSIINKIVDYQAYVITEVNSDAMQTFTEWNALDKKAKTADNCQDCISKIQSYRNRLIKLGQIKPNNVSDYNEAMAFIKRYIKILSDFQCGIKDNNNRIL